MNRMVGVPCSKLPFPHAPLGACPDSMSRPGLRPMDSGLALRAPRNDEGLSLRLRPKPFFLLAQFRGQGLAKIPGRKRLADLDLGPAVERRALHPADGFIERLGLDQPEAGNQVTGQRKRTTA